MIPSSNPEFPAPEFRPSLDRPLFLLLTFAALCLPVVAGAGEQPDPRQLLAEMAEAAHQLNYDGIFVYRRDNGMYSMRIIHRHDGNGERERLVSLTGKPREILRDNEKVTCIMPGEHSLLVARRRPHRSLTQMFSSSLDRVARNYRFVLVGKDWVAQRPTYVIDLRPVGPFRFARRLWIDEEKKLLLRSSVSNRHGRLLEEILFTEIRYPQEIPDELLAPSIQGESYSWQTLATAPSGAGSEAEPWQVTWLPDGFEREHTEVYEDNGKKAVAHMVFGDGLATISVFIEKLDEGEPPMRGFTSVGAVTAYGRVADGYQILTIGAVPPMALRLVNESVRRR
ncbi:MAG: hypothetical protein D6786_01265 [Gammaproteobacteria bacterium]|nr:MAG: hypothetical protein D6786_01265 [Gammaproteobacteria bacterium]